MDLKDLNQPFSVEELVNEQTNIRSQIKELNAEYAGKPFPGPIQERFADLKELDNEISARVTELSARAKYIASLDDDKHTERSVEVAAPRASRAEQDIFDLTTIPRITWGDDSGKSELRDRAMRAIEVSRFPHTNTAEARDYVLDLMGKVDNQAVLAERILKTGSPVYGRAFGKMLQGAPLSSEETRALSLTAASGGFAVPITIDPTVIPTSNSSVNPLRAISRIEHIVGDEWRGVSSGAVTVAYAAEATETTDNSPTLAQPVISTEKAQAFIPFSIEIGMDWSGMQADMGRLLQEGKDDLEADKFFTGSGTNEPFGVITGATNTINATTGQTFDAEDLYRLEAALPPRYRARASFVGNRAIYNLVRQFVLTGQSNPWKDLEQSTTVDGRVGSLLGYPAYEASGMTGTTATGIKFLILGDFNRFVIVDRIGLDVEVIPHLVGTNHRPTGQRGLYAYFRNSSKVVDANAFRVLLGIA